MVNYRQQLEQKKGQRSQIKQQLAIQRGYLIGLQEEKENLEAAQVIIQLVAQATQEELKYHISELVSLALASVFEDAPQFDIEFKQRNNQVEAFLWFVKNGNKIHPLSASGGGFVDVAAFALRVSLHSLKKPRSRPILVCDEPFSHVKSKEANIKALQMVKEISKRLKLQVLMISDERVTIDEIENGADRIFKVTLKKGVSQIEMKVVN